MSVIQTIIEVKNDDKKFKKRKKTLLTEHDLIKLFYIQCLIFYIIRII